ncbi:hypothetical protein [Pseudomonas sp. MF6754]|uniref:hypothetical protein n=1 Tax=Pseudomonas sp. MF6754 TaxID=2797529 RepID=UPI00190BF27C|nr:hypothetical protein [Pseudomonas sp. MF6754]MBK3453234.1 hypothetical protein [Pseudomonas sp. MF6754]
MCRNYVAVIDMSTASNGYDQSSLIDLNSKGYGANAMRQRFAFAGFACFEGLRATQSSH